MRNRTYGGVRGRKTKVGRKLLRFPPTRFYNSYLGANILMYDKMDESEYPYFFVTTVFYNGMMTNKGIYQMPIMNGETTG